MSFNVENLFDNEHDPEHLDWEYLPKAHPLKRRGCQTISNNHFRKKCLKTDWSPEVLNAKLDALAMVIKREGRQLPDLIGLMEVENKAVIEQLLQRIGNYNVLITSGSDGRGINVALLVKEGSGLNIINRRELVVDDFYLKKPTRNVLEVTLKTNTNETVKVYVNHSPSQGNPTSDRLAVAQMVSDQVTINDMQGVHSIVIGDLNSTSKERPHPVDDLLVRSATDMVDIQTEFMNSFEISDDQKESIPPSAYFYYKGRTWNKLDRILVSRSLADKQGMDVSLQSFDIYAHPQASLRQDYKSGWMVRQTRRPNRFYYDHRKNRAFGASDHFPVSITINY